MRSPYVAKSLLGAQARVRKLERLVERHEEIGRKLRRDRYVLAQLAAKTPQFSNPTDVWEAERLRDQLLGARP